ncbi:alkylation response protein AidB-like acyl-CoA dehydrogenase [Paracoccus versutus]|uniref:Alkylation response protein AidB-like acyl-CoA dehydrogenase n=1 Tax=Paracoccus versutus TaxID=34007 RepID=A0AAQ0HCF2_PARVE|nr:acyl-CoA dehydrogenase family protein [Paracoccus versutus]REG27485.1 alkylation response protein AidB-like acyl-CoA dehydrogenase [Paracoccus versutus]
MFSRPEEPDHRQQLRESVADFANREATLAATRAGLATQAGFSHERWKTMAELGWTGILVPEDDGGLAMEHADLAALHHEAGRAALPEPLVCVGILAMQALVLGGNQALKDRLLPGLMGGDLLATLAWQGRAGAMGSGAVGPKAAPEGEGWTLSGQALFVPLAQEVGGYAVAADTGAGILLAWIDQSPKVVQTTAHTDGSRQSTVDLDGVKVDPGAVIAFPDRGAAILDQLLDIARLAVAAQLQGVMEAAFQMTLDYMKQRVQFGKPIASFQAIQHRAVNLYVHIEMARSALLRAAAAMDDPHADAASRAAHVSAAKSRAGDAAQLVVKECIQLHGAIGYTEECDLSLYVNRALALAAWLGNPRAHRARWFELHNAGGQANGH